MVLVLKHLTEWDDTNCAIKLYNREDDALKEFEHLVREDLYYRYPYSSTQSAEERYKEIAVFLKSFETDGEFEEPWSHKIYYDRTQWCYEYVDYNDNYNTIITLKDLPII